MLAWPDRSRVDREVRLWAQRIAKDRPALLRLGYFGSYARGDWGVGSDLDLVAVVASTDQPFERRPLQWDLNDLPVPAEILVYTEREWHALRATASRFAEMLAHEVVWVFPPAA